MKNKLAWLEAGLLVAPFVALALVWKRIRARVPIHWNFRGEIDGWSSKTFGLLLTPCIGLAVVGLLHVVSRLDPKLRRNLANRDRMNRVLQVLRIAFASFFDAILAIQIAAAFGYKLGSTHAISACVLLVFLVIGNYLPKLQPNYFVGIRTPWTLENSETWRATHRLGGKLMFFGSLLLLILQFFVTPSIFGVLLTIFIALLVLWAFLYSWYHFRTHAAAPET